MPERERGTLPRLFADWPVQQASPPGFASRKSPQVEARLRVNDTRAHAPEAPWQTYFLGAEDIQKYSIGAREQMSCVDANETSRILARPPAARSIKLREIQGHTPGSSRGFARAASSFYSGAPSGLRLADHLGNEFTFPLRFQPGENLGRICVHLTPNPV
jgi:hypothetical protein